MVKLLTYDEASAENEGVFLAWAGSIQDPR